MKLQYNTVELNIKQLNEKLLLYNEACEYNDRLLSNEIMVQICQITIRLKEAIKNGDWYSEDLVFLNGPSHKNPNNFYVFFNKKM